MLDLKEWEQSLSEQQPIILKKKRGRKPKPGSPKQYFTYETEQAIIRYNSLDISHEEKNFIFEKYIHKAIKKLAYFTARSYTLFYDKRFTIEDMEDELYLFIFDNLHRYMPEKKSKAFSYFSTISKHHSKHISEDNFNLNKASDDVEDNMNLFERKIDLSYRINENLKREGDLPQQTVYKKVTDFIRDKIENDNALKELDRQVGYAIIMIIENHSYLTEPSEYRPSIHLMNISIIDMIMEITGEKEKKEAIKKSIKKFKEIYLIMKSEIKENSN